jgi:hypothetical protein
MAVIRVDSSGSGQGLVTGSYKIRKTSSLTKELLASLGLFSMELIRLGDDYENYWPSRM